MYIHVRTTRRSDIVSPASDALGPQPLHPRQQRLLLIIVIVTVTVMVIVIVAIIVIVTIMIIVIVIETITSWVALLV